MRFYSLGARLVSLSVLIWVNFISTIFGIRKITTKYPSKAFLHNSSASKRLDRLKNIDSVSKDVYIGERISGIKDKYKRDINPFNQSPKEILANLLGSESNIAEHNRNKKFVNYFQEIKNQVKPHQDHKGLADETNTINNRDSNITVEKSLRKGMNVEYDCEPTKYIEATSDDASKLENFDKIWNAIVIMRKNANAPVDSMGAHCLADKNADTETQRFQYLVACLLSSQTKDNITSEAVNNLRDAGLLSIHKILESDVDEIDRKISKVGFHSTKAKNLKKICEILKDKFDGKVPGELENLTSLPGIGPKMAHLILQLGFGKVEGIAVDVHVHRIANRLGWVKSKNPEETRKQLEQVIPRKFWAQLNVLLVGFGQLICTKAGPGCSTCLANSYCPVGRAVLE